MALEIYAVTIEMVRALRPVVEQVGRRDASLADQLRRAAASVPLNVNEGAYAQGGNARSRFYSALGSAAEVKACLDVAEAFGYVAVDAGLRAMVERVIGTLYRLVRR